MANQVLYTNEKTRGEVAILGQLATLDMRDGKLQDAEERYKEILKITHQLNDPESEALAHHQLGEVYLKSKRLDDAEKSYREAARIRESQGNLATDSWHKLAILNQMMGKLEDAEAWYRKTINIDRQLGDPKSLSITLSNFADLLQKQSARLKEAQTLAEEALSIKKKLNPKATEIWKTYIVLAQIAQKQNDSVKVLEYSRAALEYSDNLPEKDSRIVNFILNKIVNNDSLYGKKSNSESPQAIKLIQQAGELYSSAHYAEAIKKFDEFLVIYPNNSLVWYQCGVAFDKLENYEKAISHYDTALKLQPNFKEGWNRRGTALQNLGRYEEAIISYNKGVESDG